MTFELLLSCDLSDGAFGEAGFVFGDVVVIPGEFDFGVGFEGFDDGENLGGNFCVAWLVSDKGLETGLFGVSVFAGLIVIEVFDDLEACEFAG